MAIVEGGAKRRLCLKRAADKHRDRAIPGKLRPVFAEPPLKIDSEGSGVFLPRG